MTYGLEKEELKKAQETSPEFNTPTIPTTPVEILKKAAEKDDSLYMELYL